MSKRQSKSDVILNDRYRVLKRLGEGGMGKVVLVEDLFEREHKRPLALKLLANPEGEPPNEELLALFRREFETLAQLRHPGLAQVHDFGRDRETSQPFFTVDYVEGADLFEATRGKSAAQLLPLLIRVTQALDYLHAKGVLHNDLKTGNVLVERASEQPKILDFGLSFFQRAEAPGRKGHRGSVLYGTSSYLAPELISGGPPTVETDLFALGMVFYKVLAGKLPQKGKTQEEIFRANLAARFPDPRTLQPKIPAALGELVLRLLALDPRERPANAAEVAESLANLAGVSLVGEEAAAALRSAQGAGLIGRMKPLRQLQHFIFERIPRLRQVENPELMDHTSLDPTKGFAPGNQPLLAVIVGEAGTGKTALLQRLKQRIQVLDVPVMVATVRRNDAVLAPWRRIFRELFGLVPRDGEVWKKQESFFRFFVEDDAKARREFETMDQTGLFVRMRTFLRQAFAASPYVLALDDGDQGDETSFAFLEFLIRSQSEREAKDFPPLLVTARKPPVLGPVLSFTLEPLTASDCRSWLQQIFVGATIPEELAAQIFRLSGGNPYFIEELLRTFLTSCQLLRQSGRWNLQDAQWKKIPLPEGLRELFQARWRRLGSGEREALALAAVYEDALSTEGFLALLGQVPASFEKTLAVLEQEGIFTQSAPETWSLRQGSFAEAIREDLPPDQARALHERIARFLTEQKPKDAGKLAFHFSAAGESREAATYALEAGREASRLFARERSRAYFEQALREARRSEGALTTEIEALKGLAEVRWRQGNFTDSLGAHAELEKLLLESPQPEKFGKELAEIARARGIVAFQNSRFEEARTTLEAGVKHLGRSDSALRAELLAHLAVTWEKLGAREKQEEARTRALALVTQKEKFLTSAIPTLLTLAPLERNAGKLSEAQSLYEQVVILAEHAGDAKASAAALNNLGALAALSGRYEEARELLERNLAICRKMEDAVRLCNCLTNLGKLEFLAGHFVTASRHLLEAYGLARAMRDPELRAGLEVALAQLETAKGNYRLAGNYLQEAETFYVEKPAVRGAIFARLARAQLAFTLGKFVDVRNWLKEKLSPREEEAVGLYRRHLRARLALKADDPEGARAALTEAKAQAADRTADQELLLALCEAEVSAHGQAWAEAERILKGIGGKRKKIFDEVLLRRLRIFELRLAFETQRAVGPGVETKNLLREASTLVQELESQEHPESFWRALALLGEIEVFAGERREGYRHLRRAEEVLQHLAGELSPEEAAPFWEDPERRSLTRELETLSSSAELFGDELRSLRALNQKLFRLLEINAQLASGWQSRSRLLEYILDVALELTQAKRAFVILRQGETFSLSAARNLPVEESWQPDQEWSRAIVEEVVRAGRPKILLDAGSASEFQTSESVYALRLRSVLCAPLQRGGQGIGALYLDDDRVQGRFGKVEEDILQALANQAILALQQMEAREQMTQSLEETSAEVRRLQAAVQQHKTLEWKYSYSRIIGGKDASMRRVFQILDRVIPTQATVLIQGESGTGKELVAQAVHYNGPRKEGAFVSVNCGGLSPTLLESELFGHRKGSFTGADQNREGLLVAANQGTIFLDEIGDMPLDVQAKLLRVLQEGEVRPLGADHAVKVDVRFIAATHKRLAELVEWGEFRQDFYYRLNVVQVDLPPLRERTEDFDLLLDSLLAELAKKAKRKAPKFSAQARAALRVYPWPGNVRELANVLEGMLALKRGRELSVADLPAEIREAPREGLEALMDLESAKEEFVREYLKKLLQQTNHNISQAARKAKVHRRSLYRLLERYGLVE